MARVRIPMLLCVPLLASAFASAAGVPELRGSSTAVSGVYSLTFNLRFAATLPAGTMITCRARIVPNQGAADPRGQQPANPVGTVMGLAVGGGSTATCATEIPFSWTMTSERNGVVLSYEIQAVSNSGPIPVLRSSGQQNVGVALPAPGGRASLNFNLSF